MSDDSFDDFTKFQIQKDNYEIEKTVILQKDEVKRLKDELKLLHSHIQNSKHNFSQTKAIYRKKARSIIKEIESVPVSTSIIKSNMISSHTKAINSLKHEHHKVLKGIRIQYSERMKAIKISGAHSQVLFDDNSDFDQLNDAYIYQNFQNTEDYELEVQCKISVLNQQIAQQLIKSEELEEKIDKMKEIINQERKERSSYISNGQNSQNGTSLRNIKNVQGQKNNQFEKQKEIQSYENTIKVEEAYARQEYLDELNQLRAKINQILAKSQELKIKVKAKYTDSSPELSETMQSLSQLQAIYQQTMEESHSQLIIEKSVRESKKILKQTVSQLKIRVSNLDEVQKEHDSLLEEIKRLDFMIYGRKGRFQTIYKVKKKNHWIS